MLVQLTSGSQAPCKKTNSNSSSVESIKRFKARRARESDRTRAHRRKCLKKEDLSTSHSETYSLLRKKRKERKDLKIGGKKRTKETTNDGSYKPIMMDEYLLCPPSYQCAGVRLLLYHSAKVAEKETSRNVGPNPSTPTPF